MRPPVDAKRLFDLVVSSILLIVTAPAMGIVALLVKRDLGSPVLFRQQRPGLHGRIFTLIKFRTMREALPGEGVSTDEERMTSFGRALRSTSLDELPSLLNVLRGDMSLVGPRPLLVQYLDRYTRSQARRHEVRPGITGLSQTSGRNDLDWDDRLALDVEYVDGHDFAMDLRILWRTVAAVVCRTGITADGQATMAEFDGSTEK